MTDYTWPTGLRPLRMRWGLISNTQVFSSPLTRSTQTLEFPGAAWQVSLEFGQLKRSEIASLEALMAQLRGQAHRVVLWHMARETPRGSATTTGQVDGSGQTGVAIDTDGWSSNQTGVLLPGDFVQIGGELKIVTEALDTNSAGDGTLTFEPPLRQSPANNSAIIISAPTARFMLTQDSYEFSYERALAGIPLTFIEDVS